MEGSEEPLHSYTQLLGLCHTTRTAVRGTPRQLSISDDDIDDEDPHTSLTADALAALVGPCLGLVKLTLDIKTLPEHWEAARPRWADEAFAGHSRLAVLEVATPSWLAIMPALPGIVSHLHGLEAFRLVAKFQTGRVDWRPAGRPLLEALGRSCPKLRLLHLEGMPYDLRGADLHLLAPIAGTLEDLRLPVRMASNEPGSATGRQYDEALGAAFFRALAAVRRLSVGQCPEEMLRRLAPQLTELALTGPWSGMPLVGDHWPLATNLRRLEVLALPMYWNSMPQTVITVSRLPTAGTLLRSVRLTIINPDTEARWPQLVSLLDGLPCLADLTLTLLGVFSCAATFGTLPAGLLDRLERLGLHFRQRAEGPTEDNVVRLASRHLRTLSFSTTELYIRNPPAVELACPRLDELILPDVDGGNSIKELILDCPQLRTITGLPSQCRPRHWAAMPHLERVRGSGRWEDDDDLREGLSHLLEGSPRLHAVLPLSICQTATLSRLLATAHALTRLSISVPISALPTAPLGSTSPRQVRALRLPAQLVRLRATIDIVGSPPDGQPADLLVEAPGLHFLAVRLLPLRQQQADPGAAILTVRCPTLVVASLDAADHEMARLELECPRLATLRLGGMSEGGMEGLLAGTFPPNLRLLVDGMGVDDQRATRFPRMLKQPASS
ncbi:hypothetical protein PAPYR_8245 [Paratrimastix pyriformis]|uniref:Uncharacterized protein n=1 Tax=Paratrimastix pyriformis TaxID=342808 RepID=A0ABQ8UB23_9EUKA|nr:hypothetical protein PAPYR_8245 [Paratrimastix pyriformis]